MSTQPANTHRNHNLMTEMSEIESLNQKFQTYLHKANNLSRGKVVESKTKKKTSKKSSASRSRSKKPVHLQMEGTS